ncbi:zinc finger protein, putative [Ricinus communis]|uniref:Zinc finger protein, putative n=1 Tax=Ricinus communis TaxID=3988 RepID=B9R8D1_RICCO|nr:zinc finger protein, putative [Ricinus communis]
MKQLNMYGTMFVNEFDVDSSTWKLTTSGKFSGKCLEGYELSQRKGWMAATNGTNIPAVIAFGDSIIDTGKNFPGGITTGRFSDGKVLSSVIGTDEISHLLSPIGRFGSKRQYCRRILIQISKIMIFPQAYVLLQVAQDLYELGARRIAFLGTLPLGCLPIERTFTGGETINQAAQMFNSKLSSELCSLNSSLADATIFYLDVYNPLLELIQNPQKQKGRFEVAKNGCCGTGLVEVLSATCNELNPFTCLDASKYVFWDSAHPTERAYRIIVSEILYKYAKNFSSDSSSY